MPTAINTLAYMMERSYFVTFKPEKWGWAHDFLRVPHKNFTDGLDHQTHDLSFVTLYILLKQKQLLVYY